MIVIDEQTRYQVTTSNYADIEPGFLIVHSSCASKRAKRTLDKQCSFAVTANLKAFHTLCNKTFDKKKEAQKALQEFEKKLLGASVEESKIKAMHQNKKRGKPPKDAKPDYNKVKNRRLSGQFACPSIHTSQTKKLLYYCHRFTSCSSVTRHNR